MHVHHWTTDTSRDDMQAWNIQHGSKSTARALRRHEPTPNSAFPCVLMFCWGIVEHGVHLLSVVPDNETDTSMNKPMSMASCHLTAPPVVSLHHNSWAPLSWLDKNYDLSRALPTLYSDTALILLPLHTDTTHILLWTQVTLLRSFWGTINNLSYDSAFKEASALWLAILLLGFGPGGRKQGRGMVSFQTKPDSIMTIEKKLEAPFERKDMPPPTSSTPLGLIARNGWRMKGNGWERVAKETEASSFREKEERKRSWGHLVDMGGAFGVLVFAFTYALVVSLKTKQKFQE